MRCGQRHGAPVRSARPPPAECEYDEVWTCERGLSVLPVTTGHPPYVFQMRINQQEGVLVLRAGVRAGRARGARERRGVRVDARSAASALETHRVGPWPPEFL